MPIYCVICPAGHKHETFHKMDEPHPPCETPGCGLPVSTDFTEQKPLRERHFSGLERMSLQFGFNEAEVEEARMEFGSTGATIDDQGDVYFDNRSQEKAFRRRWKEIESQTAERKRVESQMAEQDNKNRGAVVASTDE